MSFFFFSSYKSRFPSIDIYLCLLNYTFQYDLLIIVEKKIHRVDGNIDSDRDDAYITSSVKIS